MKTFPDGNKFINMPMPARISFCCTAIFLLLFSFAHAQLAHTHKKENFDVHEFQVKAIHIPPPDDSLLLTHIGGITVIDARADTGRVGFMQKKVVDAISGVLNNSSQKRTEQRVNKKPTFLRLGNGVKTEVTSFARQLLLFSRQDSLPAILMVVKKLWLSDELNLDDRSTPLSHLSLRANKDAWTSGIDVEIEFYLAQHDGYYPLYRYDSVISRTVTISEFGPEFIALAIRLSFEKMQQVNSRIPAIAARRKFSLHEIEEHNQKEYDIPALRDSAIRKGVYMTFEEFKNNKPASCMFVLRKDKLTDIVYIKQEDGTEYPARTIWGYSDGANTFVKAGDNFFMLQRMEKAFYVFGAKNMRWDEGQAYPVTAGQPSAMGNAGYAMIYYKNSRWELQLKPFQLDWSSGLLY